LTDLLEKREEETKKRLDEVEKEWTAAREEMQEARQTLEEELEKEKARGDALEARTQELRNFADHLAAGNGNASLGDISSITTQNDDVFGNASMYPGSPSVSNIAAKVAKSGGMSYTEIYTSYIKMQESLMFEKEESKRLSECLNEILGEIQDRAPMLREQRHQYERAIAENNDLSVALAQALEDKENLGQIAEARLRQIEEKDREAIISAQQLEDTARQVRTLTRRVAALEDPTIFERGLPDEDDMISANDGDVENADTYISQNLVTFKTIDQLQKQNLNLLKIVRQLGKKMEAEEQAVRDRVGRAENEAVEEAHDLILRLKEEVENQRVQMNAYQRERDMLRQVLKNRGGQATTEEGESEGMQSSTTQSSTSAARAALEEVQRNFEAYKREMVIDNQSLRDDLSSARKEVSQLHIEVARSKAEKEYADERLKTLRSSNERVERELAGMAKRNMELQSNMARLDDATRRVSEEVLDLKGSLDRATHEAMMLKAEKQVWKVCRECYQWCMC
jgi:nucleoprotein TPR